MVFRTPYTGVKKAMTLGLYLGEKLPTPGSEEFEAEEKRLANLRKKEKDREKRLQDDLTKHKELYKDLQRHLIASQSMASSTGVDSDSRAELTRRTALVKEVKNSVERSMRALNEVKDAKDKLMALRAYAMEQVVQAIEECHPDTVRQPPTEKEVYEQKIRALVQTALEASPIGAEPGLCARVLEEAGLGTPTI